MVRIALQRVGAIVAGIPTTEADKAALDRLFTIAEKTKQGSLLELAASSNEPITPGIWAMYILLVLHDWNEQAKGLAVVLPDLRQIYPSNGEDGENEVLDLAAEVVESLGWADDPSEDEDGSPEEVMTRLDRLALALEKQGNSDMAYDLVAAALALGPDQGPPREQAARHGIRLGLAAGRMHQVSMCSAYLAKAVANAADSDKQRRLEAFDCCERTMEWLALTQAPFQTIIAEVLSEVTAARDYLKTLRIPLYFFFSKEKIPKELVEAVGAGSWPRRISTVPRETWTRETGARIKALIWEHEVENARLALEAAASSGSASADWTAWTIEHPAYRRAVPHLRSFLREFDFDGHLLVLTHEMTHVLSLIGGIGTTLTVLRVAALDTELRLWSLAVSEDSQAVEAIERGLGREGAAPLRDGNAGDLFRAQHGVELTLKARALQDIWAPWFEGVAMFSELAADPALDPVDNGWVTEAIRNLVDFYPAEGENEPETVEKAYGEFYAEIEKLSSEAIERSGRGRLRSYFKNADAPYLAGYLAVRGVAAAWRKTSGRPLTGTACFNLLLHATRFGTMSQVPDLSLPPAAFFQAALRNMCEWAAALAQLPREDIEKFFSASTGKHATYAWEANRLVESGDGLSEVSQSFDQIVKRQLREALCSVMRTADVTGVSKGDWQIAYALEEVAKKVGVEVDGVVDNYAELVVSLARAGVLLPMGRTAAKFYLNVDEQSSTADLATQLRTTEDHVVNRKPSVNGLWFPISLEGGKQIHEEYRKDASPRMEVTRVIDLGGIVWGDGQRPSHLLVFKYGDWMEVRGASAAVESLLQQHADRKDDIERLVRMRLYPEPVRRAELEVIARGEQTAARTLEWIQRSKAWRLGDVKVNTEPWRDWAEEVANLAERIQDSSIRAAQQKEAGQALLLQLFNDAQLAKDVVDAGFETLTENASKSRSSLVGVLFKTAQRPSQDQESAEVAEAFRASGLPVLAKGPLGWDVRPACAAQAKGAV